MVRMGFVGLIVLCSPIMAAPGCTWLQHQLQPPTLAPVLLYGPEEEMVGLESKVRYDC